MQARQNIQKLPMLFFIKTLLPVGRILIKPAIYAKPGTVLPRNFTNIWNAFCCLPLAHVFNTEEKFLKT